SVLRKIGIKEKQARRAVCQPFTKPATKEKYHENEPCNTNYRLGGLYVSFSFRNPLFYRLKTRFGKDFVRMKQVKKSSYFKYQKKEKNDEHR
ncbi:hypothetical protein, partial [Neisseria meningitidis]|uniref:hypothetical protein n=2 Tax=Neisseria meningitidis TaxID=487 RepID=UPI0022A97411